MEGTGIIDRAAWTSRATQTDWIILKLGADMTLSTARASVDGIRHSTVIW